MLLSARWSKSTDALDAALCFLGVFSVLRGGSTRHTGKRRSTVLSWLRTLARRIASSRSSFLYLETCEARVRQTYPI